MPATFSDFVTGVTLDTIVALGVGVFFGFRKRRLFHLNQDVLSGPNNYDMIKVLKTRVDFGNPFIFQRFEFYLPPFVSHKIPNQGSFF